MIEFWVIAAIFGLAWANGANDVSKGVATLVGSGVTRYRSALIWGSLCTAVGGAFAFIASTALFQTFSHGFLSADAVPTLPFALAVACGALAWIALATRFGLPVSTTHAVVGALLGIGAAAYGPVNVLWGNVAAKVAVPLLFSPFLALAMTWLLAFVLSPLLGSARELCLCVGVRELSLQAVRSKSGRGEAQRTAVVPGAVLAEKEECVRYVPTFLRLDVDAMHWLSSGATSLARGMNDAPKMAAVAVPLWSTGAGLGETSMVSLFCGVAIAMGLGSFLAGLRVTKNLAERVTAMTPGEGFAANLATSLLVIVASRLGMPVSTTHVSSMAIVGVGLRRGVREVRWRTVGEMALAWLVTCPVAAALGVAAWWAMGHFMK